MFSDGVIKPNSIGKSGWQSWVAEGLLAFLQISVPCNAVQFSPLILLTKCPPWSVSQSWERQNSSIFAHQMFSSLVLGIAYNIWLLYHQWFVISHQLGSWVLFVLVGVIWSTKEIGGVFRQCLKEFETWNRTWFDLHHGKQWLLLLTHEWSAL